jgi:biofilm PGA synthesis N-glycosyltransferase PgaC
MSVNARDWSTRRRLFPVTVRLPLAAANDSRLHRRHYLPVWLKFLLAFAVAAAWAAFAFGQATRWIAGLESPAQRMLAQGLILGVAVLPAFMNAFLAAGLLLDRRPSRSHFADSDFPGVTILMAVRNAESSILATLASIAAQRYPGPVEVLVVNDGSTDATLERLHETTYPWLQVLDLSGTGSKSKALNAGLRLASHDLTITLDADAQLHPQALRQLVSRYMSDPTNTAAVAGALVARHSQRSFVASMQAWDDFHGISAIRRVQSLCQATLVAPGAFSLYRTDILRVVGGWPECAGEDTVLTWAILRDRHRVGYAEDAIAFVRVPTSLASFVEQRRHGSRGVVEAFKAHGPLLFQRRLSTFFIGWSLLFPYIDLAYSVALIPALLWACTGVYWLAGAMLAFAAPMALLANLLVHAVQSRMYRALGLALHRNPFGLLGYALMYGLVLKTASVAGYLSGIIPSRSRQHNA